MLDNSRTLAASNLPKSQDVEFYTVELAPLSDGQIFISLTATTADGEHEPQLANHHIASDRFASIDDALALIKSSVQIA